MTDRWQPHLRRWLGPLALACLFGLLGAAVYLVHLDEQRFAELVEGQQRSGSIPLAPAVRAADGLDGRALDPRLVPEVGRRFGGQDR